MLEIQKRMREKIQNSNTNKDGMYQSPLAERIRNSEEFKAQTAARRKAYAETQYKNSGINTIVGKNNSMYDKLGALDIGTLDDNSFSEVHSYINQMMTDNQNALDYLNEFSETENADMKKYLSDIMKNLSDYQKNLTMDNVKAKRYYDIHQKHSESSLSDIISELENTPHGDKADYTFDTAGRWYSDLDDYAAARAVNSENIEDLITLYDHYRREQKGYKENSEEYKNIGQKAAAAYNEYLSKLSDEELIEKYDENEPPEKHSAPIQNEVAMAEEYSILPGGSQSRHDKREAERIEKEFKRAAIAQEQAIRKATADKEKFEKAEKDLLAKYSYIVKDEKFKDYVKIGEESPENIISIHKGDDRKFGGTGSNDDLRKTFIDEAKADSMMKKMEKGIYCALLASGKTDEASEYYDSLYPVLEYRYTMDINKDVQEYSRERPHLSTLYSYFTNIMQGRGLIKEFVFPTLDKVTGGEGEVNIYDPALTNTYLTKGIRSGASEYYENKYGVIGSFGYGVGTSLVDMFIASGLVGSTGLTGKTLNKVTSAVMATSAIAPALIDAKERGLSDSQALSLAFIAGASEYLTEKYSVEAFLSSPKNALGYFVQNFFTEGSEEVASNMLNTLGDIIVSRDKSEWIQSIHRYEEQGFSESVSLGFALRDKAEELGVDFLAGALAGGLAGGTGLVIDYANVSNAGQKYIRSVDWSNLDGMTKGETKLASLDGQRAIAAEVIEKYSSEQDSAEYKRAVKAYEKLVQSKKVSSYALGRMAYDLAGAFEREGTSDPGSMVSEVVNDAQANGFNPKLYTHLPEVKISEKANAKRRAEASKLSYDITTDEGSGNIMKTINEVENKISPDSEYSHVIAEAQNLKNELHLVRRAVEQSEIDEFISHANEALASVEVENVSQNSKSSAQGAQSNGVVYENNNTFENTAIAQDSVISADESRSRYNGIRGSVDSSDVEVYSIDSIDKGTVKVRSADGSESIVHADDIVREKGSASDKILSLAMQQNSNERARLFLGLYKGEDINSYSRAFEFYYNNGYRGENFDVIDNYGHNIFGRSVDYITMKSIFDTASAYAKLNLAKAQKSKLERGKIAKREKGSLSGNSLSSLSDSEKIVYQSFAESFGVDIEINKTLGEKISGIYEETMHKIAISLKSKNFLSTFLHEIGHIMKIFDPEGYEKIKNFVCEWFSESNGITLEDLISKTQERYRNQGESISREEAKEEITNNALEALQKHSDFAKRMADTAARLNYSHSKFAEVTQKIKELFTKLKSALDNILQAVTNGKVKLTTAEGKAISTDINALSKLLDLYISALESSQENYRKYVRGEYTGAQSKVNTDSESDIKYQIEQNENEANTGKKKISYDFTKSFAEQIEDFKKGKFPRGHQLIVSGTPEVLQNIGFNAVPITYGQGHLNDVLKNKIKDHNFGEYMLKQIPEALKDPVAVIESRSKDNSNSRVVVLLSLFHDGKRIITPVEINGQSRYKGRIIDTNVLTSVHMRGNVTNMLVDAINTELDPNAGIGVYYINKNKAIPLLWSARVQFPRVPFRSRDGFIHSIRESNSSVKLNLENVTKSLQFKEFFGDWTNKSNNNRNVSRIVDDNGEPLKIYPYNIANKNNHDTVLPFDIMFKEQTDISEKTDVSEAVYANIRNPIIIMNRDNLSEFWIKNIPEYAETISDIEEAGKNEKTAKAEASKAQTEINETAEQEKKIKAEAEKLKSEIKEAAESEKKAKAELSEAQIELEKISDDKENPDINSMRQRVTQLKEQADKKAAYTKELNEHAKNLNYRLSQLQEQQTKLEQRVVEENKRAISEHNRLKESEKYAAELVKEYVKKSRFDGIIIRSDNGSKTYVAFKSSQIKSVDNIGTFDSDIDNIHYQIEQDESEFEDYDKPINTKDVDTLRSIGRKSINDFTSEDIQKSSKWAYKFYKELGIKSPFFRRWFGDWRAYDTSETKLVIYKGTKEYKNARAINNDTNTPISWGRDFKSETINHQKNQLLSKELIAYIPDIVENAILLDSRVSTKSSNSKLDGTSFIHDYYALIEAEGNYHLYKLFVEQALGKNGEIFNRAYQLKRIEKVAELSNSVLSENRGLTEENSTTTISISNLFALVKKYDKNFNPKEVDPSLLNSDGTPKQTFDGKETLYTASYSEQKKSIDNIGTFDSDIDNIHYQMEQDEADSDATAEEITILKKANEVLARQANEYRKNIQGLTNEIDKLRAGDRKILNRTDAQKFASEMISNYKSKYSRATLTNELIKISEYIKNAEKVSPETLEKMARPIAEKILLSVSTKNNEATDMYNRIREVFSKGVTIKLNEEQVRYLELTYDLPKGSAIAEFRKRLPYGVKVTTDTNDKGAVWMDDLYTELSRYNPDMFDEGINFYEQAETIADVSNKLKLMTSYNPYYEEVTKDGVSPLAEEEIDYNVDKTVTDIICAASNVPEIYTAKEAFESAYSEAKAKFSEELQKLRADYQASKNKFDSDIREIRADYRASKEKFDSDVREIKADYRADYRASKEKFDSNVREIRADYKKSLRGEKNKMYLESRSEVNYQLTKWRDARAQTDLRNRAKRNMKRIVTLLANPKKGAYVPESLMKEVLEASRKVDMGNWYDSKDGAQLKAKLEAVKKAYEEANKDASSYDPRIPSELKYLSDLFENGKTMAELTNDQMYTLCETLERIISVISDERRQLGVAEYQDNVEMASKAKDEIVDRNAITKKINLRELSPIRILRMMCGYVKDAVLAQKAEELREGSRRHDQYIMDSTKPFDSLIREKKKYKSFTHDVIDTGLKYADGTNVYLTRAMMVYIYMAHERTEYNFNLASLRDSGLTIPDAKLLAKGKVEKAYDANHAKVLKFNTPENNYSAFIGDIKNQVLKDEYVKRWYDTARNYFTESGEKLNEVSRVLLRRNVAYADSHYVPFARDENFLMMPESALKFDATMENAGMFKNLVPNATQPLVISGINQIVQRNISDVARMYGYAIPIRNLRKLLNTGEGENGNILNLAINRTWGVTAKGTTKDNFLVQLLNELETGKRIQSKEQDNKIFDRIGNVFAIGALTGNLSVIFSQFASYPIAGKYLDYTTRWSALLKIPKLFKVGDIVEEIDGYTAAHYMRRLGMSHKELKDMLNSPISDKLGAVNPAKWIQGMDCFTTALLFLSTKDQVHKDLKREFKRGKFAFKIGSPEYEAEFKKRVTDMYNHVIEDTQPMYGPLFRPDLLRSSNGLVRGIFVFQTQTMQARGLIVDAAEEWAAKHKAYRQNPNAETKSEVRAARRNFRRTAFSFIDSYVLFAALKSAVKLALRKEDDLRDENGDLTLGSILIGTAQIFGESTLSTLFPVLSKVSGGLFSAKGLWDVWNGESTSVDELSIPSIDLVNEFFTKAFNLRNAFIDEKKTTTDIIQSATEFAAVSATLLGVPAQNILNAIRAPILYADNIINHRTDIGAGYNTKETLIKRLYNSMVKGDSKQAGAYRRELLETRETSKKIVTEIASLAGYGDYIATSDEIDKALAEKLKTNDTVHEVYEAYVSGEWEKYDDGFDKLVALGFESDIIISSLDSIGDKFEALKKHDIDSEEYEKAETSLLKFGFSQEEINRIEDKLPEREPAEEKEKTARKAFTYQRLADAIESDDIEGVIKIYKYFTEENGVEAKTVKSQLTRLMKPKYKKAYDEKNFAECKRIRDILIKYCGFEFGRDFYKWLEEKEKDNEK